MKMIEHTIDLHGPGCHGKFARPDAVGAVLARIKPTIRETVRMGFLGSSRLAGRPLREMQAVGEIMFGGQSKGPHDSTRLHFKAPQLSAAAPKIFEQKLLWEDDSLNPDDSAFDLLGDLLNDVRGGVKESNRFDSDLLKRVANFDLALRHGITELQFHGHRNDALPHSPAIDRAVTITAKSLYDETPAPSRSRVSGRLDMIRVSDRAFDLVLDDGRRIRAVWAQPEIIELREFLNTAVLIEGLAIFRPSGALLRMDATAIVPAKSSDALFSAMPHPAARGSETRINFRPQSKTTGINAVWGAWPGEESEEELLEALKEVR